MSQKGYGTKFYRSADGGTSYTQVSGMKDIEQNEITRGSSDDSTIDGEDGYMEFTPVGLRDPGEISLTLIWKKGDTNQQALRADLDSDTNLDYRVEYPDGTTVDFVGHITGWGGAIPIDGSITRSVKFKISGKPVVTEAT